MTGGNSEEAREIYNYELEYQAKLNGWKRLILNDLYSVAYCTLSVIGPALTPA